MKSIKELIKKLKGIKNQKELNKLKRFICKKYKLKKSPTNIELLTYLKDRKFSNILISKPVRTISGVTVIAVMTKPFKCPHVKTGLGPCIMCPGGPNSVFGDVPQSYTGKEPATRRAIRNKFDPYLQIFNRLEHYVLLNQDISKAELIIMGGTFLSFPKKYKEEFVTYCYKAMNDFSKMFFKKNKLDFIKFKKFFELPGKVDDKKRVKNIQEKLLKLKGKSNLEIEKMKNEKSNVRCIALCLETRPDYCKKKHIKEMLKYGTTRVELGVQTIYDEVLEKIKRGHTVKDSIEATRLLKDSFIKVGYHMMPGLPSSSYKKDVEMFKELFENQDYKPDALKIYPCMVLKGTKLYERWKKGKYKPLTTKIAYKLILEVKKYIPRFCRVLRVLRDIPTYITEAGVDITNFRQKLHELMKKKGIKCKCIRCREPRGRKIDWKNVKILRYDYEASNGKEIFLSAEDVKNDILLGFCRLRITKNSAGIRELHVYGSAVGIGKKGETQHKGLGKELMLHAEKIAKNEFNVKKLLVISGVGVKEYYISKLKYKKDGVYVSKKI